MNLSRGTLFAAVACAILATDVFAQDVPGISAGAFVERRTDCRLDGEKVSLQYYGLRLKLRSERHFEGFVDLGHQTLNMSDYDDRGSGAFGLGTTLWLTRADDDLFPADIGLYGCLHVADTELSREGTSSDAKYTRFMIQGVVRAFSTESLRPYLRVGVAGTQLSVDSGGPAPDRDVDELDLALNVGVEYEIRQNLVLVFEGTHSEGVGGAIRLEIWF